MFSVAISFMQGYGTLFSRVCMKRVVLLSSGGNLVSLINLVRWLDGELYHPYRVNMGPKYIVSYHIGKLNILYRGIWGTRSLSFHVSMVWVLEMMGELIFLDSLCFPD